MEADTDYTGLRKNNVYVEIKYIQGGPKKR